MPQPALPLSEPQLSEAPNTTGPRPLLQPLAKKEAIGEKQRKPFFRTSYRSGAHAENPHLQSTMV